VALTRDEDVLAIAISDIPAARANEVSLNLLKTIKALGPDKALKVRLRKFSKPSLLSTQRYALVEGLRIGLRYVGEWAYIWKLTAEQIKAAEVKAERLAGARSKKSRRPAHQV